MKPPEFKRWRKEDEDAQGADEAFKTWASSILERIVSGLTKALTFSENFDCVVFEGEIRQGDLPYKIERLPTRKVTGVQLLHITESSGGIDTFTAPIVLFWKPLNDGVQINLRGDLPSATASYKIRVLITGG